VIDLAVHGATLYVADAFYVAALNAATGRRLWITHATPEPDGTGMDSLAVTAGRVFIQGQFSSIDGVADRHGLAALDAATGLPIASWRARASGTLAIDGSRLVIGDAGRFGRETYVLSPRSGAITSSIVDPYAGSEGVLESQSGAGTQVYYAIYGTTF
jgi:outer membrane protein assembly factor BamB